MTDPSPDRLRWDLHRADCAVLALLLAGWGGILAWQIRRDVPFDPANVDAASVALVRERIDPNTASAASLRRLPDIGPKRADAIIAQRARRAGTQPAFRRAEDMKIVEGFGPARIDELRGRASFPDEPTTQP
jgi:DNA uptake protein ComE-like DNA-binding protein